MQKISVCMIAKNAEHHIKKALEALKDYPVELIVVDTGSTDATRNIAEKYTKFVYDFPWCDDFSAAKNFALKKASGDMVLVLDSDEYMEPFEEKKWQEFLGEIEKQKGKVGRVLRKNYYTEDQEKRENSEWINRVFSKELFHYEGRIHEQVQAKNGEKYETYRTPLVMTHSGYDLSEEEKKAKAKRNLALLQKELTEIEKEEDAVKKTKEPYLLYQIGKSYFWMKDYENACIYFDRGLSFDLDERSEYVLDMVESYGYALLNSGKIKEALSFTGIYDAFSYSADFLFLMGFIYMKNAMFAEAVQEFEKAALKPEAKMTGVNSYLAYYNIGVIYECLGKTKEARTAYEKCGTYAKARERLLQF